VTTSQTIYFYSNSKRLYIPYQIAKKMKRSGHPPDLASGSLAISLSIHGAVARQTYQGNSAPILNSRHLLELLPMHGPSVPACEQRPTVGAPCARSHPRRLGQIWWRSALPCPLAVGTEKRSAGCCHGWRAQEEEGE